MAQRKKKQMTSPTEKQSQKFDLLFPLLTSALSEMRMFSAKKQDGPVNKTKIALINRLLKDVKEALSLDSSTAYLDMLDEEVLPQNSDIVLILGQYKAAMEQFKEKYYGWDGVEKRWFTRENPDPGPRS